MVSVRAFAWHDFHLLYRYRRQALALDSALALSRGGPVSVGAMVDVLNPASGIFTALCTSRENAPPLVGQFHYPQGDRAARLSFLLPQEELASPDVFALLDGLAIQAGCWGAFNLLAEVNEHDPLFETMRRAGFSVYGRMKICRLDLSEQTPGERSGLWQEVTPLDEVPIRGLFQSLVPPLVQAAEPLPINHVQGLVYHPGGNTLAYVQTVYGPQGIYLRPYIHPGVESVSDLLAGLLTALAPLLGRPVYVAVPSYQAWLETRLERLGECFSQGIALLVKYLAPLQRAALPANHLRVAVDKDAVRSAQGYYMDPSKK